MFLFFLSACIEKSDLSIFFKEPLKQISFNISHLKAYSIFGRVESWADVITLEKVNIECLCEMDSCLIQHKSILFDTYNMSSTIPLENASDVFWVARCDKY